MRQKTGKSAEAATNQAPPAVRVDKWLWAARFFKTRSLASTAVKGGKIEVDGHKAKPSTNVRAGQQVSISKSDVLFVVDVQDVADKRGSAPEAQALYNETAESATQRAAQAEERRVARISMPQPVFRPDKKQRRQLRRFKQGD